MREKLSWREAERVVRAYRTEQALSSCVDVSTLGTSESEVRRLAGVNKRFVDRSGLLSAALALGVSGILALSLGSRPTGNVTVGGTSRTHATPLKAEKIVVIDLNTGKELSRYPDDEPIPSSFKTL